MIIKSRDPKDRDIAELDALLKQADAPAKRFLIERELRAMKAGIAGEEDCAYYINFYFGKSDNWCVLHDLRIEHQGRVAQIDHLLINRLFEIYVIESKNFSYEVSINDSGEFTLKSGSHSFGIPSPIEQNKRHVFLLEKFISENGLTPRRLGIPIAPHFRSLVLMSPKSVITRPDRKKFNTDMVIKADTLRTKIDHIVDNMNPVQGLAIMGNMSKIKTVADFAKSLRSQHSSASIDYRKKFGIEAATDPIQTVIDRSNGTEEQGETKYYCFKCRKAIPDNVARFCWNNKERFGGRRFVMSVRRGCDFRKIKIQNLILDFCSTFVNEIKTTKEEMESFRRDVYFTNKALLPNKFTIRSSFATEHGVKLNIGSIILWIGLK